MSTRRRYFWPLLIAVAVVQSAALFKIVYNKDRLLKSGREIVMPVKPLDPRDIFRGDYVILGYDISTMNNGQVANVDFEKLPEGSTAYVTLSPKSGEGWTISGMSPERPAAAGASDVVIKGRVDRIWRGQTPAQSIINMSYGIETYFVPEGTGKVLEDKVREHKIDAIVAVGDDGTAALKGLVVDGERHVDPPLL